MSSFRRRGGEKVYTFMVGEPKDEDHLEDPRHKWEDNIKMGFKEIRCGVDWIHPAQDTN
jgi:hypothetical protein